MCRCDLVNKDTHKSFRVIYEFLYPLKHLLYQFTTLAGYYLHIIHKASVYCIPLKTT